jgi:enoyl-[acyl-carrier protein] reductase II
MKNTRICTLLNIQYPVIQAPMVWITGAKLAAAVSNAGGMGVIGPNAGPRTPTSDVIETGERLRREIQKARTLTGKPFAVNIVLPIPAYPKVGRDFSDQTARVAIEEKVPAVVLVGDGVEVYIDQFKKAGITVLHRGIPINTMAAKRSEELGVDCIIAVGFEGGGHSGTDKLPTFVLVPQIVDAVKIPVVAGGGIMDGRGMAAALALGAEGIYMGTRFMATPECETHPNVKKAILEATDTSTATCTGIFGTARALRNRLMDKCIEVEAKGGSPMDVTRVYGGTSVSGSIEGDLQDSAIVFGADAGMIHDIKSAADIVHDVVNEADRIIASLK